MKKLEKLKQAFLIKKWKGRHLQQNTTVIFARNVVVDIQELTLKSNS